MKSWLDMLDEILMQQLLSSSMDKTVRLWDIETQTCLKMFAHNDYGEIPRYIVATHQSTPVLNLPSHIFTSDESLCGSDLHILQSSRWRPLYQRFTGWKSSNLECIWSESCGLDRSSWNGYCYLLLSWWRGSYISNFYWFPTCQKQLTINCSHIREHSQLSSESTY